MKFMKMLEDKLTKDIDFGVSVKGKEAAEVSVQTNRILVEVKNPFMAASMAVKGYFVARNLKKLKERILKASKKITVKYGPLSFDI